MRPTLQLQDVTKSYDGGATFAVRSVSLDVAPGELVCLLGGSGCGKTTTLKMINRLIEPTDGRIVVNGIDVTQQDPVELRRSIGYVFQGVGLFPHMSIAQNVAITPRLLGWDRDRVTRRVDELLELVHLPADQFRDRLPGELSGGQRQRVGFARALAVGPEVMLMDEPFGALDPITRDSLQSEFLGLHQQLKLTAVMVTHDMMEALLLADRIAVMNAGRILRIGTPRELMTDPQHDYVRDLIQSPKQQAERLEALVGGEEVGERK